MLPDARFSTTRIKAAIAGSPIGDPQVQAHGVYSVPPAIFYGYDEPPPLLRVQP